MALPLRIDVGQGIIPVDPFLHTGSDSKQSLMLSTVDEVSLDDVDSILVRETVAKKYANFFQSTLHHNNGYFLQVSKHQSKNLDHF